LIEKEIDPLDWELEAVAPYTIKDLTSLSAAADYLQFDWLLVPLPSPHPPPPSPLSSSSLLSYSFFSNPLSFASPPPSPPSSSTTTYHHHHHHHLLLLLLLFLFLL